MWKRKSDNYFQEMEWIFELKRREICKGKRGKMDNVEEGTGTVCKKGVGSLEKSGRREREREPLRTNGIKRTIQCNTVYNVHPYLYNSLCAGVKRCVYISELVRVSICVLRGGNNNLGVGEKRTEERREGY